MRMHVFGRLSDDDNLHLKMLLSSIDGILVERGVRARSSKPLPRSVDLDVALVPHCESMGYQHQVSFIHPKTKKGYIFDFWNYKKKIAIEILGYRADDEVYKDILKFHVHRSTKVSLMLIPRWKWISGKKSSINYLETQKALHFAASFMNIDSMVAVYYSWVEHTKENTWKLCFPETMM